MVRPRTVSRNSDAGHVVEQPELLWVEMQSGRSSAPSSEFSRHCHIRLMERTHLWSAAQLATSVDVICLDFDHPDIDGLQFAAATKMKFPSIPIVMLISEQSAEVVLWALRARIFDVLIKPVTAQEVLRITERLAPILAAKRKQSSRANIAGIGVLPAEVRFRTRNQEHHKLATVKDFIAKNYAQQIEEADVAQMCSMNAFRFSRVFRKAFGTTFRDYLADCRIKQAQRLLRNPDITITDVASIVGFNDPSYFARLFRKRVGVSPTSFQESLAGKSQLLSDALEEFARGA
jgi:YesN/AraC family two-component response regulator